MEDNSHNTDIANSAKPQTA